MRFDHASIERKWQDEWERSGLHASKEDPARKKYYALDMFPYPSGNGLHVGHPEGYTATDIVTRKRRMEGWNVLHPMGFDAFGLPAENYAIKTGVHPRESTENNIVTFRRQLRSLGFMYDWSREVNTSDPAYYRWTQWMFLFLYKNGLAYRGKAPVNWCDSCRTVLANEQVVNGACERCGNAVVQKELEQWFFRVTTYADRLLAGLEGLDWPDRIKAMQRNWIGRSEGAEIAFSGEDASGKAFEVRVFTTRPDTLFGVSYLVLAPEHPLVARVTSDAQKEAVDTYVAATRAMTEIERTGTEREKTGVPLGVSVRHPFTGEEIPLWTADYALATYGTGAVMGVPAHDDRDFAFATAYGLPITTVIEPVTGIPQKDPEYRRSIVAVVEDPSSGKVLTIDWGEGMGGNLFVGGGRDEGEDAEVCASREIMEETGYDDLELVGTTETIHHNYFAHSKNVARSIDAVGLHFRLKSDSRRSTAREADEEGKFSVAWLPPEQAAAKVHDDLHAYVFRKFFDPGAYTDPGILVDSGEFSGLASAEARRAIAEALREKGAGDIKVNYHLRDWLISRQRYWGAPIPIIHCEHCGEVPVPEEDLPVLLPDDVDFRPTGESPLARSGSFHKVSCPDCGKPARRESDTMDTFVDSSWYFLRYVSPHDGERPFAKHAVEYWSPVDLYVGGAEHAVLHLLYARFFTMALKDFGEISFDEPFLKLRNQGLILGENGEKMSKSRGNVINPDDVVEAHGADTLRLYEMFMGEFDDAKPWDTKGIIGVRRFLDRLWQSVHDAVHSERAVASEDLVRALHKTVKKVGEDIEAFKFNTAIAAMMILLNRWTKEFAADREFAGTFVKILAPFAPHLAEELWHTLGHRESVFLEAWPSYDTELVKDATLEIPVQVNGKVRDRISVAADLAEDAVRKAALASEKVQAALAGKEPRKVVVVPGRLVNIVV